MKKIILVLMALGQLSAFADTTLSCRLNYDDAQGIRHNGFGQPAQDFGSIERAGVVLFSTGKFRFDAYKNGNDGLTITATDEINNKTLALASTDIYPDRESEVSLWCLPQSGGFMAVTCKVKKTSASTNDDSLKLNLNSNSPNSVGHSNSAQRLIK